MNMGSATCTLPSGGTRTQQSGYLGECTGGSVSGQFAPLVSRSSGEQGAPDRHSRFPDLWIPPHTAERDRMSERVSPCRGFVSCAVSGSVLLLEPTVILQFFLFLSLLLLFQAPLAHERWREPWALGGDLPTVPAFTVNLPPPFTAPEGGDVSWLALSSAPGV